MSGWVFPDGHKPKGENDEQDDRAIRVGILGGYLLILVGAMFIHYGLAIMLCGVAIYMQSADKMYDENDEILISELKKALGDADKIVETKVEDLKPQGPPNTEHPEGVQPPPVEFHTEEGKNVKKDG